MIGMARHLKGLPPLAQAEMDKKLGIRSDQTSGLPPIGSGRVKPDNLTLDSRPVSRGLSVHSYKS